MTNEENQRVNEYLVFTHVRMGEYKLAYQAMESLDTSRLWTLQRDTETLSGIIEEAIKNRKGIQHAPEQMRDRDPLDGGADE
jgi:hypothetical protein